MQSSTERAVFYDRNHYTEVDLPSGH